MIELKRFEFNPFRVNTYLLYNEDSECIVVDPSNSNKAEDEILFGFIRENDLDVKLILNTHGHVDHLLGVKVVKEKYNVPFFIHSDDMFFVKAAVEHGAVFGLDVRKPPEADKSIDEGQEVFLGSEKIELIHVPGHSPGSLVLFVEGSNIAITGDVLFQGSIGRTDLQGGNYEQLIGGIKDKLLVLDQNCIVYPGHGPSTSIKAEKESNPFLQ